MIETEDLDLIQMEVVPLGNLDSDEARWHRFEGGPDERNGSRSAAEITGIRTTHLRDPVSPVRRRQDHERAGTTERRVVSIVDADLSDQARPLEIHLPPWVVCYPGVTLVGRRGVSADRSCRLDGRVVRRA